MKISKIYNNIFLYIPIVLIAAFLNFFHYDEALMYQNILNYNLYDKLIDDHGYEITFGKFFFVLFSKLPNIENIFQSYFVLRTFSVASVISILILLKMLIGRFYSKYNDYIFISYSITVLWFCFFSGGISIRFDALVSFCILFSFFATLKYKLDNNIILPYLSFTFSVLFFSLHPNFLLPILLILPVILKNIFFLKSTYIKKITKIAFIIFVLLLSLNLTIFTKLNLENIYLYINKTIQYFQVSLDLSYRSQPTFYGLFLNIKKDLIDLARIHHLKNFYSINYYILIILSMFFLFSIIKEKTIINRNKTLIYHIFFSIFFLLLIPNKWAHHISLIIPLLILYFYVNIISKYYLIINKFQNTLFVILFFIILIVGNNHLKNNYFFYQFFKAEAPNLTKFNYFNEVKKDHEKISQINRSMKGKIFHSNPEHRFIFFELVYKGHVLEILLKQNKKIDLFFLEKKFNSNCIINDYLKLRKLGEFKYEGKNWLICERENIKS